MKIKPPLPLLRNLMMRLEAHREEGGVQVGMTICYSRRPVIGWLFEAFSLSNMVEHTRRSLQNLKSLLEEGAAGGSPDEKAEVV